MAKKQLMLELSIGYISCSEVTGTVYL